MLKTVVGSIVVVAGIMTGVAFAQDTASLSPVIPATSAVYDPCKAVSDNPEIADVQDGICVNAARGYLASLQGTDPGEADQALADAVAAIAALAMADTECNVFDDEIAAAIRILSTRSSSTDQMAPMEEIAKTIEDCALGATAAILPDDALASLSPA